MKRFTPAFAAIALTACATVPAASATTGTATARYGETANVGPLLVRPIALVEDSRCPIKARCVWAGRLVITAEVTFHGGSEQYRGNMTLGSPLMLGNESVMLVAGEPGKLAGADGNPPASRFTFEYGGAR